MSANNLGMSFPGHPPHRSDVEAVNQCLAQREKVQTRLRREAVTSRDQALRLMQRADKLERAANFLDSQGSHIEELIREIAIF